PSRISSNPSPPSVNAFIIKQTLKVRLNDFNFLAVLGKENFGK
ncbi:5097_t:CDS:1, partial [Acaulospora morrowiae]